MAKTRNRLEARPRTALGHKNRTLRRQGLIPGHIYGHGDSVPIQFDAVTFDRMRQKRQTTGLLELLIAGAAQPENVLVRHIQREPRTGAIQHVDFQRVALNEPIHAHVPITVVGESPAAKAIGGIIFPVTETIEIEALPEELPDHVEVLAERITTPDMIIHAGEVDLPQGVKLLTPANEPVLKVQPPRVEVTVEEIAPTATAAAPETAPPAQS